MELLANLQSGFGTILTVINLAWCFFGVTLGTMVGVIPGLGPLAAISLLIPLVYNISDPVAAIIFISGIYYGTQYGGAITSILLNLPGESSSIVTAIDGHAMTKNGRGGSALFISAVASFIGGTVATLLIMFATAPISNLAFVFGHAEYASMMVLAIIAAVALSNTAFIQGLGMVLIGILLGLVGTDINTGMIRFSGGVDNLSDGVAFAAMAMGMFGLAEILYNLFNRQDVVSTMYTSKNLWPTKQEVVESASPTIRGSIIGCILGLLPGGGALISSFAAYSIEKKISKDPDRFGKGHPAGLAAPEAANNAGAQASFVPMLSLGLPINPVMALVISILIIYGIQPGPQLIESNKELFWGLIASMWVGNVFLLILNLPLVGLWIKILHIKKHILYPFIIFLCIFGTYQINNNWFDVWLLLGFGAFGYLLKWLGCEPAPMAMGFLIGPMLEEYVRRSLIISHGDWTVFIDKPISVGFLIVSAVILILTIRSARPLKSRA